MYRCTIKVRFGDEDQVFGFVVDDFHSFCLKIYDMFFAYEILDVKVEVQK